MFDLPPDSIPTRTLALLVAGQLPPEAVPQEQWAELIPLALDHGLGGMLLWSLRQAGWALNGEPRWQPLVDAMRCNGRRSLLLEKVRRQAMAAFDGAGVPTIWLKGTALAYTYYPEPHLRPMDDLDVLVPLEQLAAARQALLIVGFRPAEVDFFELGGFTDQARHHENLVDLSGQVRLELHFRLLVPSLSDRSEVESLDWFWTQTEELASAGIQILKPEAILLYLCAHVILQSHSERLDLLHLLDLHLLVAHSRLDWERVVEQAATLRWTYAVERAIGWLPDLFGTQLPEGLLLELQERRPADERPPITANPWGSTRRWDEWRQAYKRMTASQRLRLVWRTLFPPKTFMRRQYHLSSSQSLLPYYLDHFLDGGREVRRALRRRSSGPEHSPIHSKDL